MYFAAEFILAPKHFTFKQILNIEYSQRNLPQKQAFYRRNYNYAHSL
jgi:hypothetical protein